MRMDDLQIIIKDNSFGWKCKVDGKFEGWFTNCATPNFNNSDGVVTMIRIVDLTNSCIASLLEFVYQKMYKELKENEKKETNKKKHIKNMR
jgi:hypothetical protein